MDIETLIPFLSRQVAVPDEIQAAAKAAASKLTPDEALSIIHNVSNAFGIKKPILVQNSTINNASIINGVPVIHTTNPIQHTTLIEQMGKLIGMVNPIPNTLFNIGLMSALPVGYVARMLSPEGGVASFLPSLLVGLSAAPKVYQQLKLHNESASPYSAKEVVDMGRYLVPVSLAAAGNIIAR